MITFLECAELSNDVYNNVSKVNHNHQDKFKGLLKHGWHRINGVDPKMKPSKNFYAALYIKFKQGRATDAALAIRGTSNFATGKEDIISWFSDGAGEGSHDQLPSHFSLFVSFAYKARRYLEKHYNRSQMVFTGHSLGGAYAQLLTLMILPYRAVVFNSPGCGHIKGIREERGPLVTNINSRYGVINKVGAIVKGEAVYVIDVPNREAEAEMLFDTINKKALEASLERDHLSDQTSSDIKGAYEDTIGFVDRAKGLGATGVALAKLPTVHNALVNCGNKYPYWKHPVHDLVCRSYVVGKEYEEVIVAQHSIAHMLRTLMQVKYKILAQFPSLYLPAADETLKVPA